MDFTPIIDLLAAYILIVIAVIVIGFLLWLFIKICQWVIFQKAGQAGWKSLIPIYETFVMLRIIRRPQWWGMLIIGVSIVQLIISSLLEDSSNNSISLEIISSIATLIALIYSVRITHGLSRSFGRGIGFTLGLLFLPYIFYPILAFGSSSYQVTQ